MIKIYKNNIEYGIQDFIENLHYYMIKYSVDEEASVDYTESTGFCEELKCTDISEEKLKKLKITDCSKFNMILQFMILLYNNINCYDPENIKDYIDWINEFDVVIDNNRNKLLPILELGIEILDITSGEIKEPILDYFIGIFDTVLLKLNLSKKWAIIYHYETDDEDLYPYPNHLQYLKDIKKEHKVLSKSKIVLDNFIGYFIIKNDISEEDFTLLKLSLDNKDKIISSFNLHTFKS